MERLKTKDVLCQWDILCEWIHIRLHLPGSQGSQVSIEISCKIRSFGYALYCTLRSAVPQPGRLLQQPYIASIGVTPQASCMICGGRRW